MHSYLRAIGLSKYNTRRQLESVYMNALRNPNRKIVTNIGVNTSLIQIEKDFAPGMGLAFIGECDTDGNIFIEHYYPYIRGKDFLSYDKINIKEQTSNESYYGFCEDANINMSLIFFLQNTVDYAKSKWFNYSNRNFTNVRLSAFSTDATVILGIKPSLTKLPPVESLDDLTPDSVDPLEVRMQKEDILTIVSTSFMPYGIECDHYLIIGNILEVELLKNKFTKEKVYKLLVEANKLVFTLAINKADLLGEPAVGRRIKGEIWMQGFVQI